MKTLIYHLSTLTMLVLCVAAVCLADVSPADVLYPPNGESESLNLLPQVSPKVTNEYSVIDVLFLYSPEALTLKGTKEAVQDSVDTFLSIANETFRNGGLKLVVKSAGLLESPLSEVGDAPDILEALALSSEVAALRESSEADIVSFLISHNSESRHCGNAYILNPLNENAQNYGHHIVSLHPNCEDWVFTHELGHNLGAEHDKENAGSAGLFDYSYGYKLVSGSATFRTIMAIQPGTVLRYFSSPLHTYQGQMLGTVDADNLKTIGETHEFVAKYRGRSSTELTPSIDISGANSKKACVLSVTARDLSVGATYEFYSKNKKGKTKLLKSIVAESDETSFQLKRGKRSKVVFAKLQTDGVSYDSTEFRCPKRKRRRKKR